MTVDEKYDTRVGLCRALRVLEDEIEKITNTRSEYNQSKENKKATLSIYVGGKSIQYELNEKTASSCMEVIERSYSLQKDDVIQTLKQELK